MPEKILIVDDEREIADLLEVYLKNENYSVSTFYSALSALKYAFSNEFDLAVLDVMLPDMSGFDLCRKIREKYNCPIIMLTAKTDETDKITGLTLGADDYITKPFRPLEVVARVKAQLRRYKKYNSGGNDYVMMCSGLALNAETHECTLDDKPLALTPTEFEILRILLENRGSAVSSESLFHQIWKDEDYSKSSNTITVHIRHLREKMNDVSENPRFIKTIWGVGYKIEKQ